MRHKFFALLLIVSPASLYASSEKSDLIKKGQTLSSQPAKTVEACLANSTTLHGQTIKVEGEVKSVCQKKGCWFVLQGEDGGQIRITSMGYKFFVPKDAKGMFATIEGKFEVQEIDAKLAQHYEDDRVHGSSEKAQNIRAARQEFAIAATAVELRRK
ncbi:MAG: DUF4920 domain-containing protein [Oligoflexus sp.]